MAWPRSSVQAQSAVPLPGERLGASLRDRATLSSPLRGLAPSGGYPSRLRSQARCALRLPGAAMGGWALLPTYAHCRTRAHSSNPDGSSGRSAPCGLAQEPLGRAVKVADREVGLARNHHHLACGAPDPEEGPGASARRSQPLRRPTRNAATCRDPAPGLPYPDDAQLPHHSATFRTNPAQEVLGPGASAARA